MNERDIVLGFGQNWKICPLVEITYQGRTQKT
jgi:hypothetical protein